MRRLPQAHRRQPARCRQFPTDNGSTINVTNPASSSHKPTVWAISEYYQPNFSGAAIQAHRILSRLVAQGYPVHVLTAADQAARHLAGQVRCEDGVRIHYLPRHAAPRLVPAVRPSATAAVGSLGQ